MRRIVLTGGGTGGHIIPNIAVIQKLKEKYKNLEMLYIGSKHGPEEKLIKRTGIDFKSVFTGKYRRYFSFSNFIDFFKVPWGIWQAYKILKRYKPNVVFSKGGFVSIPVVYAAKLLKLPIVLHESDVTPGLANRLASKKANFLCLAHFESQRYFPAKINKVVTGNPIREMVLKGDKQRGYQITGFNNKSPVILVMGGSSGAQHINDEMALAINALVPNYQILHICGKGKTEKAIPLAETNRFKYRIYEYVEDELPDFYAISDLVITRAGANSLAEIEALNIPAIIVPIGKAASRGDQITNAFLYQEKHPDTKVIEDELLSYKALIHLINALVPYGNFIKEERTIPKTSDAVEKIIGVLDLYLGESCDVGE